MIGGEKREPRKLVDAVLQDDNGRVVGLGKMMMVSLGGTMHSRYYGLSSAIREQEPRAVGVRPAIANVGTGSAQVNPYSFAIIRALKFAGSAWHHLMGWESEEWSACTRQAHRHEADLVRRLEAETGSSKSTASS